MSEQIPEVLFENDEFLVLNKPSGWHSVMGKGDARGERSVEAWLRQRDSEAEHLPEAGLIHRTTLWLGQLTLQSELVNWRML